MCSWLGFRDAATLTLSSTARPLRGQVVRLRDHRPEMRFAALATTFVNSSLHPGQWRIEAMRKETHL
ncbi:hypothetical protein MF672_019170 [Actinomadura sp. ATCC 31491]|uniref:Uncharacterized protein n=1 Tax=Actinomadura luzonensis TaxID=2805427 RepID=A0ABT0FUA5_9ACTN|nr:hypothetical protein [Actinomadura luzonensis]